MSTMVNLPIGANHLTAQLAILQAFKHFQLNPASNEHGLPHWSRVWANGQEIARLIGSTSINWDVIAWFAFLHDSCRLNDHGDPGHGPRASQLASRLREQGILVLADQDFKHLCLAMEDHSKGLMEGPPVVRICWDADRLDLLRVGVIPDPKRMCTGPGDQMAKRLVKGITGYAY